MALPTPQVHNVQRLRAYSEATFGADSSGSIGSFTDLPVIEGTINVQLMQDELDPQNLVQHIDEGRERVLGKRSATLSFQMNMSPTGTAASNGVSSITSPLGMLLKAIMGGEDLGEGSVAAAGSTATVVNVSAGDGVQWSSCGNIMGWTNSAGVVEWREVESRSTDAITLKYGFSGVPQTSDPLYNAASYYMTANPSESLAFLVEGLDSNDRWLLTGGQATGGFTIAIDPTGATLPRVTFNLSFADWYASDETGSSITGALGTATYSATTPISSHAGQFLVGTVGTATYSTSAIVHCSALSFEPHIAFGAVTSPSGVESIARWAKLRNADSPVQGSWTELYDDTSRWNNRKNKSDLWAQYAMGTAAGSAVIMTAPTIQVLNPQRAADAGSFAAQVIQWKGRRDTDAGGATTDQAKSPFRIHLG